MFDFIFPVIGAALVLYAFYLLASNYQHAKVWRKTTGKVLALLKKAIMTAVPTNARSSNFTTKITSLP